MIDVCLVFYYSVTNVAKYFGVPAHKRTDFATNVSSDPDGIQTHDLQIRNLTLYSAELPGPFLPLYTAKVDNSLDISSLFIPFCRAIAIKSTISHCLCHRRRKAAV